MDHPIVALWNAISLSRAGLIAQIAVALIALVLLEWGRRVATQGRTERFGPLRDRLLAASTLIAAVAWFNFGGLHSPRFIHTWDSYHYVIGAKYFPELRYDGLYECTIVADGEAGLGPRIADEPVTDLRTNVMILTEQVLAHPDTCRSRFTTERWSEFVRDVAFFRDRVGIKRWASIRRDHGFNASPVWMLVGRTLAELGPATLPFVTALCLIDLLLIALGFVGAIGAFGWRAAAVAVIVFCTSYPADFTWTGGSFLRYDWFALSLLSLSAARAGRHRLAGAALGWAAALRLFPVLLAIGPLIVLARVRLVEGRWDSRALRFLAGAVGAGLALSAAAVAHDGGLDSHRQFVVNTLKHNATPLSNHMGLPTLLAFTPSGVATRMIDDDSLDPWAPWRAKRAENLSRLRPFHVAAILASIVLIGLALRRGARDEIWIALGLATLLIAVTVELTGYYYAFLGVSALLVAARPAAGSILLAQAVLSQLLGKLRVSGATATLDERYVAISALELIALTWVVFTFIRQRDSPMPPTPVDLRPATNR